MKNIALKTLAALSLIMPALAHEGHDHGNSAFESHQTAVKEFELTEAQIHNLQLQTAVVHPFEFYKTIKIPMIVDTMHNKHSLAHGFVYEGSKIMKIKKGQTVTFKLDIMPQKEFQGKIVSIEDMIDPQSRLYSVYAVTDDDFPQNSQGLKGDMTIRIKPIEKKLGIPAAALQGEFGDYFVFVKHGPHFERREVIIGHKTGDMVEVVGVKEGETVVTTGSYQLRYASGRPIEEHEHTPEEKEHAHALNDKHLAE
uniref:CzcB-like C-terminal circularly permuted SH3-like domain-containing protein n=1 Tax=uncultured Alphaproteobacteria bacterium TaxID=91750 RepID=A0A6G8F292_9PROT|nr:hypothetical protein PlAlph_0900 [uncultured Alphaproteobacteria bacterium]